MAKKKRPVLSSIDKSLAKTSNGVLINDPEREGKSADQWSADELKAWGLYEINATMAATDAQLADRLRAENTLYGPAWSVDMIRQHYSEGTMPAVTENGVLLTDATRQARWPHEWTQAEMLALHMDWIGDDPGSDAEYMARLRELSGGLDWTEKDLSIWLRTGDTPKQTARGTVVKSDVRLEKAVGEWTDNELLDAVEGLIRIPDGQQPAFLAEVHRRFELYPGLSLDDTRRVLIADQEPAKTESGLFVTDLLRDAKTADAWTEAEYVAWARGEVSASDQATNEQLAQEYLAQNGLPTRWSVDEVKAYIVTGSTPAKLPDELSDAELKAWAKGDLAYQAGTTAEALMTQVKLRLKEVPEAWSDEEILHFFLTQEKPAQTASGFWVNDVVRDLLPYEKWSLAMLRAWAKDEISAGPAGEEKLAHWLRVNMVDVQPGWSVDDIKAFYVDGTRPAVDATYGVLINDITRQERAYSGWTDNELRYMLTLSSDRPKAMTDEVRKRLAPPQSWSDEDTAKAFLDDSHEPQKTSNGVLLEDSLRDKKPVTAWTAEELRAAAKGEIHFPFSQADLASTIRRHHAYPKQVNDATVVALYALGQDVSYTSNGVLIQDTTRDQKLLPRWTDEEFTALLAGEILPPEGKAEAAFAQAKERLKVPVEWSNEEISRYFADPTQRPRQTSFGVWASGVTRNWDFRIAILASWAKGEISLAAEEVTPQLDKLRDSLGVRYDNDTLVAWLKRLDPTDILGPDKVKDSSWVSVKPAEEWTPDELQQFLNGQLKPTAYASRAELTARARDTFELEDHVSDEDLANAIFQQPTQTLTSTGVKVHDPEREYKPASKWSKEELLAFAMGEIEPTRGVTLETLRTALTKAYSGIEGAWSLEQVKAFVAKGTTPPKTSTDVWVVDITRSERYVNDWSNDELIAWARDEIILPETVTPTHVLAACRLRFEVSSKWTDDEVRRFVATGDEPTHVDDGVLLNDPARDRKMARFWSDAELSAWLTDKIAALGVATPDLLMKEVRRRFDYPNAWDDAQIRAYVRQGKMPARTSNGVWVVDVERSKKQASEWSYPELQAWAMGEITPGANISGRDLLAAARRHVEVKIDPHAEQWSDQEIHVFVKTGAKPVKTSNGLYKASPLRALKEAREWNKDELAAYLKGEIGETKKAGPVELHQAICEKWKIPAGWYEQQIRDFVLHDQLPAQTTNGLWVKDHVRDIKPAQHWNVEELKAWAAGEIEPGTATNEVALLNEIRVRFPVSERLSDAKIKQLLATLKEVPSTMAIDFIKQNLESYLTAMSGKISDVDAAKQQNLLYQTIVRTLNLQGQEFTEGWTLLLDFVNNNRTKLFHDRLAFRGFPHLVLADRDRKNFESLLTLLLKTADPETRYQQASENTNFNQVLREITNEEVRQRLLAYYNVG